MNAILAKAASADRLGVLSCNTQPLVSADFNHNAFSSNFDANHTRVSGRLVKVLSWYDNEWGFSNRMLDTVFAGRREFAGKQRCLGSDLTGLSKSFECECLGALVPPFFCPAFLMGHLLTAVMFQR